MKRGQECVVLRTLLGRNASEDERVRELQKLKDALQSRALIYEPESEDVQRKPLVLRTQ
jgi:hypothetical protein